MWNVAHSSRARLDPLDRQVEDVRPVVVEAEHEAAVDLDAVVVEQGDPARVLPGRRRPLAGLPEVRGVQRLETDEHPGAPRPGHLPDQRGVVGDVEGDCGAPDHLERLEGSAEGGAGSCGPSRGCCRGRPRRARPRPESPPPPGRPAAAGTASRRPGWTVAEPQRLWQPRVAITLAVVRKLSLGSSSRRRRRVLAVGSARGPSRRSGARRGRHRRRASTSAHTATPSPTTTASAWGAASSGQGGDVQTAEHHLRPRVRGTTAPARRPVRRR